MPARCRILLVDDQADNRKIYAAVLEAEGYAVTRASGGNEAFAFAMESPPDLVLSDVSMPGGDGLSLLAKLRAYKRTARVPVVLMSGVFKESDDLAEGLDSGADDYIPKPVSPAIISAAISTSQVMAMPNVIPTAIDGITAGRTMRMKIWNRFAPSDVASQK